MLLARKTAAHRANAHAAGHGAKNWEAGQYSHLMGHQQMPKTTKGQFSPKGQEVGEFESMHDARAFARKQILRWIDEKSEIPIDLGNAENPAASFRASEMIKAGLAQELAKETIARAIECENEAENSAYLLWLLNKHEDLNSVDVTPGQADFTIMFPKVQAFVYQALETQMLFYRFAHHLWITYPNFKDEKQLEYFFRYLVNPVRRYIIGKMEQYEAGEGDADDPYTPQLALEPDRAERRERGRLWARQQIATLPKKRHFASACLDPMFNPNMISFASQYELLPIDITADKLPPELVDMARYVGHGKLYNVDIDPATGEAPDGLSYGRKTGSNNDEFQSGQTERAVIDPRKPGRERATTPAEKKDGCDAPGESIGDRIVKKRTAAAARTHGGHAAYGSIPDREIYRGIPNREGVYGGVPDRDGVYRSVPTGGRGGRGGGEYGAMPAEAANGRNVAYESLPADARYGSIPNGQVYGGIPNREGVYGGVPGDRQGVYRSVPTGRNQYAEIPSPPRDPANPFAHLAETYAAVPHSHEMEVDENEMAFREFLSQQLGAASAPPPAAPPAAASEPAASEAATSTLAREAPGAINQPAAMEEDPDADRRRRHAERMRQLYGRNAEEAERIRAAAHAGKRKATDSPHDEHAKRTAQLPAETAEAALELATAAMTQPEALTAAVASVAETSGSSSAATVAREFSLADLTRMERRNATLARQLNDLVAKKDAAGAKRVQEEMKQLADEHVKAIQQLNEKLAKGNKVLVEKMMAAQKRGNKEEVEEMSKKLKNVATVTKKLRDKAAPHKKALSAKARTAKSIKEAKSTAKKAQALRRRENTAVKALASHRTAVGSPGAAEAAHAAQAAVAAVAVERALDFAEHAHAESSGGAQMLQQEQAAPVSNAIHKHLSLADIRAKAREQVTSRTQLNTMSILAKTKGASDREKIERRKNARLAKVPTQRDMRQDRLAGIRGGRIATVKAAREENARRAERVDANARGPEAEEDVRRREAARREAVAADAGGKLELLQSDELKKIVNQMTTKKYSQAARKEAARILRLRREGASVATNSGATNSTTKRTRAPEDRADNLSDEARRLVFNLEDDDDNNEEERKKKEEEKKRKKREKDKKDIERERKEWDKKERARHAAHGISSRDHDLLNK